MQTPQFFPNQEGILFLVTFEPCLGFPSGRSQQLIYVNIPEMLLVYKVRTYVLLLLVVVPSFFVTINQKNKRVKETSFKRPAKYYFVVSPSTYVYPTIYIAAVPYRYLIVCIHFFCQNALNGEGFFLSHLTTTTTSRTLEYVYH